MRTLLAVTAVFAAAGFVGSQPPPKEADAIPVRFGIPYRPKAYPQDTPKQALESVTLAIDRGEFGYMVAHLLEPGFVDTRVAERTRRFEGVVEDELLRLREFQKQNPDRVTPESRIPENVQVFRLMVAERAKERGFRQLVRDVQDQLAEDPQVLKDLRRAARIGEFTAGDPVTRVGIPNVTDRVVFVRKHGDRWYVENRQGDEGKAPDPKASPDDKKNPNDQKN